MKKSSELRRGNYNESGTKDKNKREEEKRMETRKRDITWVLGFMTPSKYLKRIFPWATVFI